MKYLKSFQIYEGGGIQPLIDELIRLVSSGDTIGVRKTINDIIIQYREGGHNNHKHLLSYLNSVIRKLPKDTKKFIKKNYDKIIKENIDSLFEGFEREEYYSRIGDELYNYDNIVDFDTSYQEQINKRLNSDKLHISRIYLALGEPFENGKGTKRDGISISGYKESVLVSQNRDDWFMVRRMVDDIMSGPYNDQYVYYKCDGIDGLMLFLKDYDYIR